MRELKPGLFTLVAAALTSQVITSPGVTMASAGQAKAANRSDERLPGSKLSLEEAVKKSDLIVAASIIDMGTCLPLFAGTGLPLFAGKLTYSGAKVKIAKPLKGAATGERRVTMTVVGFPKEEAEGEPKRGQEYLLFIERPNEKQLRVIKVLNSRKEQLHSVQGEIEKEGK